MKWLALALFAATSAYAAAPKVQPASTVDELIQKRLSAINELISKKDRTAAIQTAIRMFDLDASPCRGIDSHVIGSKDDNGDEIIARTQFDQIVVIDPDKVGFKNARFLVSTLAHEITHCHQNQKLYALAQSTDTRLAPLSKVPYLRVLADLDELATAAVKDSPVRTDAIQKFNAKAKNLGLEITASLLLDLTKILLEDLITYNRTMVDLKEMEAALRALELPGVIPHPKKGAQAGEEFALQYRALLSASNRFVKGRRLLGADDATLCKLTNYVPFSMTLLYERTCGEATALLQAFFSQVNGV